MKSYVTLAICAVLTLTIGSQAMGSNYNDVINAEPSLLAYYTFDADTAVSGTTAIDATGNNNGSFVGDAAIVSSAGGLGNAIDLDGTNTVNIGTVPGYGASMLSGATAEMWIKSDSDAMEVVLGRYTGNNEQQQYIRLNMDRFNFATKDGWLGVLNVFPLSSGGQMNKSGSIGSLDLTHDTWTYLAISMAYGEADGLDRFNLFVGKEGDANVTHYSYTTTPQAKSYQYTYGPAADMLGAGMWIGAMNANGDYEDQIDEVALYSSALTYAQANAHFMAGVPEPSTFAMLLGMGLGLFVSRRRR